MADGAEVRRRPGGRSARVVAAVHDAVNGLVAEKNPGEITVAEIAERAGVNPTSIYRRWGTLEELILDVETARLDVISPVPDTGTLRGDLLAFATNVAEDINRPGGLAFVRAVLNAREQSGPRHIAPLRGRGAQLQAMLDRAADRGEPALDFTDVLDCILGPIYVRTLFEVGGLTRRCLSGFVDRAMTPLPEPSPAKCAWAPRDNGDGSNGT
jgi:AcrR family transcriptional regulator